MMDTWYELWDARNASLVGTFETREDALTVVRHSLESFGVDSVESLVLTIEGSGGADPQVVASGEELIALARRRGVAFAGG